MNRPIRRGSGQTGSKYSYREGGAWAQGGEKQSKETRKRMGSYHGRIVGGRHAGLGPGLIYRAHLLAFQTFSFFSHISVVCQEHFASCFALASLDCWGLRSHALLPKMSGGQLATAWLGPGRSGGLGAPAEACHTDSQSSPAQSQGGRCCLSSPSPPSPCSYLIPQWHCQNLWDASPHNSRATGHPPGFTAPNAELRFV